jgi:hypothetical protein
MAGTGLDAIRAELAARVSAIEGGALRRGALATELDSIRHAAHRAGLHPAVTIAHLLDDALSRGERPAAGWLGLLGDAVRSERTDVHACDTFAAACAVRFAG